MKGSTKSTLSSESRRQVKVRRQKGSQLALERPAWTTVRRGG